MKYEPHIHLKWVFYEIYVSISLLCCRHRAASKEHVQIIPISFEAADSKRSQPPPVSRVSRVMLNTPPPASPQQQQQQQQQQQPVKPSVPDKPKNIQFIKRKLETLKSGHDPSNSLNNRLKGPVLRAGSRLRANKVTLLIFFKYMLCCNR